MLCPLFAPGPLALQLELVQAKQQDITGLAEAAATRERRMEEMEEAIGALQEAVAALPPAGDMGEPGRQRLQLSRELGDINTQAWLFVLCARLLVACCLSSVACSLLLCCPQSSTCFSVGKEGADRCTKPESLALAAFLTGCFACGLFGFAGQQLGRPACGVPHRPQSCGRAAAGS